MAINKNFVIKHGFEVNGNLLVVNPDNDKIGVNTSIPEHTFHVIGGIGVTDAKITGITTALGDVLVADSSGEDGKAFAVRVSAGNSVGINSANPRYPLEIIGPASTGTIAEYVYGDLQVTGQAIVDTLSINGAASLSGVTNFTDTTENTLGDADTGSVQLDGGLGVNKNVTVGGQLRVTGDSFFVGVVTFAAGASGTIQLGDNANDNVEFQADVNSNIVPNTTSLFNLGSSSQEWRDLHLAGNAGIGSLAVSGISTFSDNVEITSLTDNRIPIVGAGSTIEDDANLTFDGSRLSVGVALTVSGISTFSSAAIFDSTGYIQVPSGTTAQRTVSGIAVTFGQVRYNTQLSQFEGFGAGESWGSLGGVKDVDGDTFIRAESAAGADEDVLEFLTAGTARVSIDSSGNVGIGTTGGADAYTLNTSILNVGVVTALNYYGTGGALKLGSASDGSLTTGGALNTFTTSSSIVNSIDDLNEVSFNIIKNTAVTDVGFTADTVAGAATLNVTLTITSSGNANRFDIDWGDGSADNNTTDSTPSHAYTDVAGGTYTVVVTAKNVNGAGAGHSQTLTKAAFITVYTPAPIMGFSLFRASSGGSALSGNDLYVIDNAGGPSNYHTLHLDNTTANATGVSAAFTVNWGDGTSAINVTTDNADGGPGGSAGRLSHQWADGTSSGGATDTVNLTITNHTTTDPAEIPKSTTTAIKVYQDDVAAPSNLGTKTIANTSSQGTSPKLASGFTANGVSGLSADDTVIRVSSGTAVAGPITTFAYDANSGTLSASVTGSTDGSRALTTGDDSGTYTSLIIDSESDYQLLNSSGSSTTFASSIYYPGLYKGFKARVSKSVASLATGANSMQLVHSAQGSTNTVKFVKDNLTASPTISATGSIAQGNAGTFRYISGVPYYNSGSPTLTLSGVTISNLVGQCHTNQTNIVEVDDGSNQEGTSSNAITNTDYTYAQIDGSTTMLASGVPKVDIGTSSAYAIGNLTVPITSSSVRTISRVKTRARNVNGISAYGSDVATNVQVHTAAQSGISEIAVAVADALGSVFDDDGVRIYNFKDETADNPAFSGSTNFYTNQPYTEALTISTIGIKESIIRLGVIKFDQTNFSSGYLPAGPDRSSSPAKQYFTFAFRRQTTANFNISITSSGIAGLWIAAPGTGIDSTSGINGWLKADTAFAGSGVPGSGTGGNGSDGCAETTGDRIIAGTSLSGSYTMTLGEENLSNATGNVALIRIALTSGQSVTSLSIS
tara:strand:- start:923 stop:4648 length:3726 start_codon:yes stop_codon:yes gene_type:complete